MNFYIGKHLFFGRLNIGGILSGTASLQGSPMKKHHPSQDFIQTPSPTHTPISSKILLVRMRKKQNLNTYSKILDSTPTLEAAAEALKEAIVVEEEQIVEEPVLPQTDQKKNNLGALAILDPANFTLEGGQPSRHRVTKESFKSSSQLGSMSDPSDPLSQLDPLWSLAK